MTFPVASARAASRSSSPFRPATINSFPARSDGLSRIDTTGPPTGPKFSSAGISEADDAIRMTLPCGISWNETGKRAPLWSASDPNHDASTPAASSVLFSLLKITNGTMTGVWVNRSKNGSGKRAKSFGKTKDCPAISSCDELSICVEVSSGLHTPDAQIPCNSNCEHLSLSNISAGISIVISADCWSAERVSGTGGRST